MTGVVQVSTTTDSKAAAEALASSAVRERLAACAQVQGPATSAFWHSGEFGTGEEWQLNLKTTTERYTALEAHLIANHPWQKPEVTVVDIVAGSADYLKWVRDSVTDEA